MLNQSTYTNIATTGELSHVNYYDIVNSHDNISYNYDNHKGYKRIFIYTMARGNNISVLETYLPYPTYQKKKTVNILYRKDTSFLSLWLALFVTLQK